jgi:hypothetical protein
MARKVLDEEFVSYLKKFVDAHGGIDKVKILIPAYKIRQADVAYEKDEEGKYLVPMVIEK